jgi:predicted AAA+ superfamily ATPase
MIRRHLEKLTEEKFFQGKAIIIPFPRQFGKSTL